MASSGQIISGATLISSAAYPIIIGATTVGGFAALGAAYYFGKKYFDSKKAKKELEESKCDIKIENLNEIGNIFKEKKIDQLKKLIYIEKNSINNDNLSILLNENGNDKIYSLLGTKFTFAEQEYNDEENHFFTGLSVNIISDKRIDISLIEKNKLKN